jgi:hypothetical protein
MFFDQFHDWHRADHFPLVRFLQHAPKGAQSVVCVGWRTADNERSNVIRSDMIESPAGHARLLQ